MNVAVVGCGYVAEFYGLTLANYPQLTLVGAYDQNPDHLRAFATKWPCTIYATLAEVLADARVNLVINLTNPRSHFAINRACLEAGKHVYSEKPLAMTTADAVALATLAADRGLYLAAAPCSVLSEAAQTLWKAVRDGAIGRVRLVYANFEDGMIAPAMQPWTWRNSSGVPWPAKDEFEVGCTFEHAGYVLTWLAAMFGPAVRMQAFSSCLIPDKGIAVDGMAPDFTVGGIEYPNGIAARVTCGLVAPRDKSITVVGDSGVLFVGNVRDDGGAVMLRPSRLGPWESRVAGRARAIHRWLEARVQMPGIDALMARRLPLVRQPVGRMSAPGKPVDFCRGPAELADAALERRPSRLDGALAAHVVELVERLQFPERFTGRDRLTTRFEPIAPMPWAR